MVLVVVVMVVVVVVTSVMNPEEDVERVAVV